MQDLDVQNSVSDPSLLVNRYKGSEGP